MATRLRAASVPPENLATRATQLKKAFAAIAAIMGDRRALEPVPNYSTWSRQELRPHVRDLEVDVRSNMRLAFTPRDTRVGVAWLVQTFDAARVTWARGEVLPLGPVHAFEREVGSLDPVRAKIEVPSYAELVLQPPPAGLAIRHPEWHLASDLSLLQNLLMDTEEFIASCQRRGTTAIPEFADACENNQTLARATITACYNLLESFVSGLAREHILRNQPREQDRKKLEDTRSALSTRIRSVPEVITGKACPLDPGSPPLSDLFGEIKKHRDSFVHCEPGEQSSGRGYVKQRYFHMDGSVELVNRCVDSTVAVVRRLWVFTYERGGPRWLQERSPESGRMPGRHLRLAPPHTTR